MCMHMQSIGSYKTGKLTLEMWLMLALEDMSSL